MNQNKNNELARTGALTPDQQEQMAWLLDEMVHDAASQQASNAINDGEQVRFLLEHGWTLEQLKQELAASEPIASARCRV